jgi:hypothetical protein
MKEQSAASNLKSGLHERLDPGLYEPLPERWVDLILELNCRERRGNTAARAKTHTHTLVDEVSFTIDSREPSAPVRPFSK